MANPRDAYKVVVIGCSGVGKTSLVSRIVHGSFYELEQSTIGIDFGKTSITLDDGTKRELHIWDTAGQERFNSLIPSYVRNADVCLIVFDVTSENTYRQLWKWLDYVRSNIITKNHICVVVANKIDRPPLKRKISHDTSKEWAEKHNCLHYQTSSKTGDGVEHLFKDMMGNIPEKKIVAPPTDTFLSSPTQPLFNRCAC